MNMNILKKNWIRIKLNIAINRTDNRDQSEIDFAKNIMQQLEEKIKQKEQSEEVEKE